jgi:hypothetical protein
LRLGGSGGFGFFVRKNRIRDGTSPGCGTRIDGVAVSGPGMQRALIVAGLTIPVVGPLRPWLSKPPRGACPQPPKSRIGVRAMRDLSRFQPDGPNIASVAPG